MGKRARDRARNPSKAKHQGHPARPTRAQKRKPLSAQTARDKEVNEIVAKTRAQAYRNPGSEGPLAGPLAAAAEHAAEQLANAWGLPEHEHHLALANHLTERLGAAIDSATPADYLAWRAECQQAVIDARASAPAQ